MFRWFTKNRKNTKNPSEEIKEKVVQPGDEMQELMSKHRIVVFEPGFLLIGGEDNC